MIDGPAQSPLDNPQYDGYVYIRQAEFRLWCAKIFRDTDIDAAPGRLIGYARVSTADQDLGMQIAALLKDGVPEPNIYRETVSGASRVRPEFGVMMRELRPGDVLTVWSLDRLSRSLPAMLKTVALIHQRGAKLRVITQQVDTTTAAGRMFLHMLGVIADFEREIGRERTIAGLARSRAEGRVGGRPPVYTEEQIREAMAKRDHGIPWRQVAASVTSGGSTIGISRLQARIRELRKKDAGNA